MNLIKEKQTHCFECNLDLTENPLIGVEIRGIYDGVLYWQCPDENCNHRTNPWPEGHRMHDVAERWIASAILRQRVGQQIAENNRLATI